MPHQQQKPSARHGQRAKYRGLHLLPNALRRRNRNPIPTQQRARQNKRRPRLLSLPPHRPCAAVPPKGVAHLL